MADLVHLERRDDGVATIRLDHPKVNALNARLLEELLAAVEALHKDLPGAVVVTGGERVFAAGADIGEFGGPEEARAQGGRLKAALDALSSLPRVVIAAIAGYALGGGCEVALACDLRVAADDAKLGQPEILLGIIPGGGGTQRLARLVGPSRAKDLVLTGRTVDAQEALRIGLVDRVVPAAELHDAAYALAAQLAAGPLVAHGLAKQLIDGALEGTLADGLEREQDAFEEVFRTEDSQTGVASFLQQGPGKATFSGR
jgi:enoyl-CoA hydratase